MLPEKGLLEITQLDFILVTRSGGKANGGKAQIQEKQIMFPTECVLRRYKKFSGSVLVV